MVATLREQLRPGMFAYENGCGKLGPGQDPFDTNPDQHMIEALQDITTRRLHLRPIAAGDAGALHTLWTNKEVRRYLWDNRIIPLDAVEAIIGSSTAYFEQHGSGFYGVRLVSSPEVIVGFCGHRRYADDSPDQQEGVEETELLYGMHPDFWSQGLGTEAALAVLAHGFVECDFRKVFATTDTPNQRSVKVLQRLGMSFDRRQQRHGLDTVFYSLTRDEFLAAQQRG
jgi:ribosomal-protein-alanine N-acetyltransferase